MNMGIDHINDANFMTANMLRLPYIFQFHAILGMSRKEHQGSGRESRRLKQVSTVSNYCRSTVPIENIS